MVHEAPSSTKKGEVGRFRKLYSFDYEALKHEQTI